jgi:hypothetical protein
MMIEFLALHLGTIVVGLLVLAGVISIIAGLVRDKKKGKCAGCGGGCGGCSGGTSCTTK